jgi:hypothetical protein
MRHRQTITNVKISALPNWSPHTALAIDRWQQSQQLEFTRQELARLASFLSGTRLQSSRLTRKERPLYEPCSRQQFLTCHRLQSPAR